MSEDQEYELATDVALAIMDRFDLHDIANAENTIVERLLDFAYELREK